jgi:hypothetical protein
MAKKLGSGGRGSGKKVGRGPVIFVVLVGFVVLAVVVQLRRVYGYEQAKVIVGMQQRKEALISEQLKVQDAIRLASDRKHIIEIAQSRLGMKMPELSQVIDLPRRPLKSGRDSLRP